MIRHSNRLGCDLGYRGRRRGDQHGLRRPCDVRGLLPKTFPWMNGTLEPGSCWKKMQPLGSLIMMIMIKSRVVVVIEQIRISQVMFESSVVWNYFTKHSCLSLGVSWWNNYTSSSSIVDLCIFKLSKKTTSKSSLHRGNHSKELLVGLVWSSCRLRPCCCSDRCCRRKLLSLPGRGVQVIVIEQNKMVFT